VVDASNNVWVAVTTPGNVLKVNTAGTVIGTYPVGTGCTALAIDANGNIWVCNATNASVTLLSPTGVILATYPLPVGSKPQDIDIDAHGNAWISDSTGGNYVYVMSPGGAIIATLTTGAQPYALNIDASGNVWWTNLSANTISKASGYVLSPAIGANASIFSGGVPLTNTAGALNVNISSSATLTVAQSATVIDRPNDGTNSITAAISAMGTAPAGTFVETVNNVALASPAAGAALFCAVFSAQAAAINIKATPGNLYGFAIISATASAGFIQFFNTATTATAGSVLTLPIPASGTLIFTPAQLALLNFSTGIAINIATTVGGTTEITWTGTVFFK
jgi:hypothetical protein